MKVLIVGLGSIAKKHVNALYCIDKKIEIFAFRTSNKNKSESYLNVINIYNLNEINFIPNFIIISNHTILHEETIEYFLKFKKPLFIEKPFLHRLTKFSKLNLYINSNNLITYTAFNMRFLESIKFLKNYIKNKIESINEINVYCGSFLPDWRPNENFKNNYSANSKQGGGVHLDLIHEIDYIYWIFGKPNKVISHKTSLSSLKIKSFDYANFILQYNNFNVNIILNYYRLLPKRDIEIISKNDILNIDLLKNNIYSGIKKKYIFKNKNRIKDTYLTQMKYFLTSLKNKKILMNNFKESYEVLKIALND